MSYNNRAITKILLLLLLRRRLRRRITENRKRRCWVKPLNRDREKKGEFRRLQIEMRLHDAEWFFGCTRMTSNLFNSLLDLVGPKLLKFSIRKPLTPSQRLALTLRFLVTGDSYNSLADIYHIGKSTVCMVIQQVLPEIWNVLSPIVLSEPNEKRLSEIADEFLKVWNMPHCIGGIDAKHITVAAPGNSNSNDKRQYNIIVMGVCDANYNFTYIDVGAHSSVSVGGIFSKSKFGQRIQNKTLSIPAPTNLPGTDKPFGHYFVGSHAFPLYQTLMRPYSDKKSTATKTAFNCHLASVQKVIENTFGIMLARWRIYHRKIYALPTNINNIIKATTCLHNFIKRSEVDCERYCPNNYVDAKDAPGKWREEVKQCILEPHIRLGSNNATFEAIHNRNDLAEYFSASQGHGAMEIGQIT